MSAIRKQLSLVPALITALLLPGTVHAVQIISEGLVTPETISQVPSYFTPGLANQGDYLVPDVGTSKVMVVPNAGGAPAVFATNPHFVLGGLFLPLTAYWGTSAGNFLTTGYDVTNGLLTGYIYRYQKDGTATLFGASTQVPFGEYTHQPFSQPLIAPDNFGTTFGGKLFISEVDIGGRIDVVSSDGSIQEDLFQSNLISQSFGIAFTPAGFAGSSPLLLESDAFTGTIVAHDADNNVTQFASIPLLQGQRGLRQMVMAPTDFLINLGIPGDLLLVSVTGSDFGGGTLGDVLALNGDGDIVASLRVLNSLDKFDPRGLLFASDGTLVIADASDPIITASASDFRPGRFANSVPEPSTLFLLAIGFASVLVAQACRCGDSARHVAEDINMNALRRRWPRSWAPSP